MSSTNNANDEHTAPANYIIHCFCVFTPLFQVVYWHVYDGSVIREVEGSLSGAINGLHISQDGKYFVTGTAHYTSAT